MRGYLKPSVPQFILTGKVPITLIRKGESYRDSLGVWHEGEDEPVEIEANIQPLGYRDLMSLPESARTQEMVKMYSNQEILGAREGEAAREADTFVWNDDVFSVIKVHHYQMGVLDHYKAIAVRGKISALGGGI